MRLLRSDAADYLGVQPLSLILEAEITGRSLNRASHCLQATAQQLPSWIWSGYKINEVNYQHARNTRMPSEIKVISLPSILPHG